MATRRLMMLILAALALAPDLPDFVVSAVKANASGLPGVSERGQDLVDMSVHFHVVPPPGHFAVVDEIRSAGVDQLGLLTERNERAGQPPPPPPTGD